MTHLKKYLSPKIALVLLFTFILTSCTSSDTKPNTHAWNSEDTSCKVVDMHYVCMRQCLNNETGPSGAQCIVRQANSGAFCDCGTRQKAPVASQPLVL